MKLLISVDIEGVAGVFRPEQTRAGNPDYECARRWMTAEANAAIAGAFEGGAAQVLVNDSHGHFGNLLPDELDARAHVIQGKPRYLSMASGVEQGVAGMCMIGYHARAHAAGVLAHTINSFAFAGIEFNGQPVGEAVIYGALAAEYGVPVLMASGDDCFAAETREWMPDTAFVQTKQAGGQHSGTSLSPSTACAAIREAVAQAVARGKGSRVQVQTPLRVTLHTQSPALADLFGQWPTFERVAPTTLAFTTERIEHAVRMLNCCSAMSAMLR